MTLQPQTLTHPHVTIVGGGITGLSAAYALQNAVAEAGVALAYTLIEPAERWGGKVLTERVAVPGVGTFTVEAGPDSFISYKPSALALAKTLGLDDALLGTNDHLRSNYVLKHGRAVLLPEGVFALMPTRFMPFVRSPLISPLGKLRMGLEMFVPPRQGSADETLAAFVTRRLGAEALDRIAEPLLSGIYSADAERQSLLATFPTFRQSEQAHGSLTRAMLAARRSRKPAAPANGAKPASAFTSLRGGMAELVDTLAAQLDGDLRLRTGVEQITRTDGGYRVAFSNGETLRTDAIIMTAPAFVAARLLEPLSPDAAAGLSTIRYLSSGTISLAYRADEVRRALSGFGLVIPGSEQRPINAITLSSNKFSGRAPDGTLLLRVFFGGSRSPQSMALDDDALLDMVRGQLQDLLGIEAPPLFHRIYRWPRANPQYDLGHLELLDRIESALPDGILLAGSAYRGIGLPDCIQQAQRAAGQVIERLRIHVPTQQSV